MKIYYVNTELEALGQTRKWRSAIQSTNKLLLQPDLDQLLQNKMEMEIQCVILAPLPGPMSSRNACSGTTSNLNSKLFVPTTEQRYRRDGKKMSWSYEELGPDFYRWSPGRDKNSRNPAPDRSRTLVVRAATATLTARLLPRSRGEMVDKLEVQRKEISVSSEIL